MLLLCLLVPFAILVALLGLERVERWVVDDPRQRDASPEPGAVAPISAGVE